MDVGSGGGASPEGAISEGRIVGVDSGVGKLVGALLEGTIAEGGIVGVDFGDGLQALTSITRTTIRIDLFIVVVPCVISSGVVH